MTDPNIIYYKIDLRRMEELFSYLNEKGIHKDWFYVKLQYDPWFPPNSLDKVKELYYYNYQRLDWDDFSLGKKIVGYVSESYIKRIFNKFGAIKVEPEEVFIEVL